MGVGRSVAGGCWWARHSDSALATASTARPESPRPATASWTIRHRGNQGSGHTTNSRASIEVRLHCCSEAQALRSQGWPVSAIARPFGSDPVDGAPVSVRGTHPRGPCPFGAGPVRRVCRIWSVAAGGRSTSAGHHVVRRGRRARLQGSYRSPAQSASSRCARRASRPIAPIGPDEPHLAACHR
jgi:hypothetical protein